MLEAASRFQKSHPTFLAELVKSIPAVLAVAGWLIRRGDTVKIPGLRKAPTREEWLKYSDHGDMFVLPKDRPEIRLDVKGLDYDFTCKQNWPFRNRYIVCSVGSWERAEPKPFAYFHVNRALTHAGFVLGKRKPDWDTDWYNSRKFPDEPAQECYFCSPDRVQFFSLDDEEVVLNGA